MAKDLILSPKTENKTIMFTVTTSIQHCTGGPRQCNRTRNKKGIDLHKRNATVSIHRKYDFFH